EARSRRIFRSIYTAIIRMIFAGRRRQFDPAIFAPAVDPRASDDWEVIKDAEEQAACEQAERKRQERCDAALKEQRRTDGGRAWWHDYDASAPNRIRTGGEDWEQATGAWTKTNGELSLWLAWSRLGPRRGT